MPAVAPAKPHPRTRGDERQRTVRVTQNFPDLNRRLTRIFIGCVARTPGAWSAIGYIPRPRMRPPRDTRRAPGLASPLTEGNQIMKHIRSLAAAVAILGVPLAAMNSASADTVCERTAERMFQSCSFEIKKEFKATRANCINFSDAEERADCRDQAAETKSEDADGCDDQRSARRDVCELLGENRYDPDPLTGESLTGDPIVFVDPDTIGGANLPNPYLSLVPGQTQVLRAGEDFEETIVVHVADQVREILGVSCRRGGGYRCLH